MIKIINIIIPFLLEILFGKKDESTKGGEPKKNKTFLKILVYIVMMLSFSFNYFSINKVYTLSISYVALKKEMAINQEKILYIEEVKGRVKQLQESLEYCMVNTYKPKRIESREPVGKIN